MHRPALNDFIQGFSTLIAGSDGDESLILKEGEPLLASLLAQDNWLAEPYTRTQPDRYQQYLLHYDPKLNYCIVSFVWGPGQSTPVHDHTVWGLIGVLRGAEINERFNRNPTTGQLEHLGKKTLSRGDIDTVSPRIGDIHRVANAYSDRDSISIHVYGANIGTLQRHTFDLHTGITKTFVSSYSGTSKL